LPLARLKSFSGRSIPRLFQFFILTAPFYKGSNRFLDLIFHGFPHSAVFPSCGSASFLPLSLQELALNFFFFGARRRPDLGGGPLVDISHFASICAPPWVSPKPHVPVFAAPLVMSTGSCSSLFPGFFVTLGRTARCFLFVYLRSLPPWSSLVNPNVLLRRAGVDRLRVFARFAVPQPFCNFSIRRPP